MKIQMMPMLGNEKTKKLVIRTRTLPETIWEVVFRTDGEDTFSRSRMYHKLRRSKLRRSIEEYIESGGKTQLFAGFGHQIISARVWAEIQIEDIEF